MKNILALLALATSGFAPAFADAPVCAKPETQQPVAPQTTPSKPVEVKKIAALADEEQGTPEKPKMMFTADGKSDCCCPSDKKEEQKTSNKPVEVKKIADEEQGTPEKPKMMFASDEVACCCPSDKKEEQKTPAQTPVKTTAPKIALA